MPESESEITPPPRGASVRLRADQSSAGEISSWIRRRGRAAPAAPEREAEHEPERELPDIDAGHRGEPLPQPRMGQPEPLTLNAHIREALNEKQLRRWRVW